VLGDPLTDLTAGHEEQAVDAGEGRVEGGRVVVVGAAHLDAPLGEVGERLGLARGGDDVGGGRATAEQGLDDEAAELATCTGDEEGHELPFERMDILQNDALHGILPQS
jgi:hypothetical protein